MSEIYIRNIKTGNLSPLPLPAWIYKNEGYCTNPAKLLSVFLLQAQLRPWILIVLFIYLNKKVSKCFVALWTGILQHYANSCLWVSVSDKVWNSFQGFQNVASYFSHSASPLRHIILILASWFWLLTGCDVKFKVMMLIFKVLHRIGTRYLRESLFVTTTSPDSCVPQELWSCQPQGWSPRGHKTRPPQQHSQSFGSHYQSR